MAEDALDSPNRRIVENVEVPLLRDPLVPDSLWQTFDAEEKRESLARRTDVLETVVRSVRRAFEQDDVPGALDFVAKLSLQALDEMADVLEGVSEDVEASGLIDEAVGRPETRQASGWGLTAYTGPQDGDASIDASDLEGLPDFEVVEAPGGNRVLASALLLAEDIPKTCAEAVRRVEGADHWRERTQRWAGKLAKWHLDHANPEPPVETESDVEGIGRLSVVSVHIAR